MRRLGTLPANARLVIVEDVWGPPFEALSAELPTVRVPDAWQDMAVLRAAIASAYALVVRNRTPVTADLIAGAPDLRVVARAGVGLDNIDLVAADALGVVVISPRGASAVSVAEHTLGLALSLARNIVSDDAATRRGEWVRRAGRELAGGTWGLLGAGATGLAVARVARAIGMDVIAYDPYIDQKSPTVQETGVILADIDQVVSRADVLSVHVPATDATKGLVGADLLARVKPGALLINTSRGEVIDEEALADVLESGHLAGAGLDVRASEPPTSGRLEQLTNVVLTPHVAGITTQSQARINEVLAEDIRAVLAGRPASHAVGAHQTPRRMPC